MQNLVVQALAMRQLGRLNPRHLVAAGYGLGQTEWCPRTIHTRQLWGCSGSQALGCHRFAFHGRDPARSWSVHHLRFKSNKKKSTSRTAREEEEEEEEDVAEKNPEDSDYENEAEEDPDLPKDYKDVERYVPSFRYDVVLKGGLDISRNKIEDAYYSNKLRINGHKLIKKSKTVRVGDNLDLVLSEDREEDTVTVMRVIVKKVLGESSGNDKFKVAIRRWKFLKLPTNEAFKS